MTTHVVTLTVRYEAPAGDEQGTLDALVNHVNEVAYVSDIAVQR